jgi:hypothetical protein
MEVAVVGHSILPGKTNKFLGNKTTRQYPSVLLVKVGWTDVKILGIERSEVGIVMNRDNGSTRLKFLQA